MLAKLLFLTLVLAEQNGRSRITDEHIRWALYGV